MHRSARSSRCVWLIYSRYHRIGRLAAIAKDEKPVEHLEERAGRLVDGAHSHLPNIREVAQELHDRPNTIYDSKQSAIVDEKTERKSSAKNKAASVSLRA